MRGGVNVVWLGAKEKGVNRVWFGAKEKQIIVIVRINVIWLGANESSHVVEKVDI